jgi:hypothetical protein
MVRVLANCNFPGYRAGIELALSKPTIHSDVVRRADNGEEYNTYLIKGFEDFNAMRVKSDEAFVSGLPELCEKCVAKYPPRKDVCYTSSKEGLRIRPLGSSVYEGALGSIHALLEKQSFLQYSMIFGYEWSRRASNRLIRELTAGISQAARRETQHFYRTEEGRITEAYIFSNDGVIEGIILYFEGNHADGDTAEIMATIGLYGEIDDNERFSLTEAVREWGARKGKLNLTPR